VLITKEDRTPLARRSGKRRTFDIVRGVAHPDYWYQIRPGDINLRLVCKAFDRAMTRAYFQNEAALFCAGQDDAAKRLQKFIIDEQTTIAPHITCLEIALSGAEDSSLEYQKQDANPEASNKLAANLRKFLPKLEDAISRLRKLQSFTVNVKEALRSEPPKDYDSDDEVRRKEHGPIVDLELIELIRRNISCVLCSPRVELRMLTHLHLTLFCAYDIATIGTHVSDDLATQLRHLHLEYTDGTGQAGSLQYTTQSGTIDENEPDYMPYSNLQRRFPNKDYMKGICTLISRCRNLKSLSLVGTQCLNLESLDWKPMNVGLENVYMSRVVATSGTLIALLSPYASSDTPSSNIVTFDIKDVQLWDRTWGAVFDHLALSPLLRYLDVYNLVYASAGDSAEIATPSGRPFENYSVIWSEEEDDERSLWRLIRKVEERGGSHSIDIEDFDIELEDVDRQ
jgi:hypothetical protein